MQMLHPFAGSIQHYLDQIADPNRYRPDHCPQCGAKRPLTGHGFYCRTLVDVTFNGVLRIRRYLCCSCKRTVSLLPEFVLPWLRFSISVIALFLVGRLLKPCGSPPSPVLWGRKTARHLSVIPPVDPRDHVPPNVRGVPLGVGGDGELSWVPGQSLWKHAPG